MQFTARRYEAKSGVVAPLQRLMHLWRAYEGPERFDCLSIGKVARWGQIRPQDALSLPQSPFDYEIVLHGSRTSAISVSSLRFTLPSAIHFGYGVAYQLGEGNECANYTQIDPTHRHGHIDGRLGRRLASDVSTRWGRISPRRNICLRRGAVHASRSATEGTQIIAGLFERRL